MTEHLKPEDITKTTCKFIARCPACYMDTEKEEDSMVCAVCYVSFACASNALTMFKKNEVKK